MTKKKKTTVKKVQKKLTKKATKKVVSKKVTKKVATRKVVTKKKAAKKVATKKVATKKIAKKATKKAVTKKVVSKKAATKKVPAKTAAKALAKTVAPSVETPTPQYVGMEIPALILKNQKGEEVALRDFFSKQNKTVLYFYPKDDTPGCTKEACEFRDSLNRIGSAGTAVLGVSPDDLESHQKFIEKYSLNFDLLSDSEKQLCETLNLWKEKAFMGRKYMGVERSTFIIGPDARILKYWQPVKVEGHVDEVLRALE